MPFAPLACSLLKQAFAPAVAVGVPFRLAVRLPAPGPGSRLEHVNHITSLSLTSMRQLHMGDAMHGGQGIRAGTGCRACPRPSPVAPAASRCCRTLATPTPATASCTQLELPRRCRGQLQPAGCIRCGTPFYGQPCLGVSAARLHPWSSVSALQSHRRTSGNLRGGKAMAASSASAAGAAGTGPDDDRAGPGGGGGAGGAAAMPRHTSGLGQASPDAMPIPHGSCVK